MSKREVVIMRTGVANLASISAALQRQGIEPELSADPDRIVAASMLVVPGVGAFGAAIAELRRTGLDRALLQRLSMSGNTLAICLGMQIMFEGSAESPRTPGLGFIPGQATAFEGSVASPQFGWNQVEADPDCKLLRSGSCYFANSFKLDQAPSGWRAARSTHGKPFIAALEGPGLLACQFHPELSGSVGRDILERWLETSQEDARSC